MTAKTLRTINELRDGGVAPSTDPLTRVAERYAVALTPEMAALINTSDPADPIARQFLPDIRELETTLGEDADPIGDKRHSPVEGIVHRYRDRLLLKVVHVCPVYCRFCFRREMVGPGRERALSASELDAAIAYIAAHPEVREVILTGGDPFVLSARRAADLTQRLAAIAHIKNLRWHTRVPVVDPRRVTPDFVAALKSPHVTTRVALHANHAREFTPAAREACARIIDAGISMLSQSVLLKGINDDAETLADLMRAFVENRIKPYYLHQTDMAPGTAHFRTTIEHGRQLMRDLRRRGVAMPAYVLDVPGAESKLNLETTSAD